MFLFLENMVFLKFNQYQWRSQGCAGRSVREAKFLKKRRKKREKDRGKGRKREGMGKRKGGKRVKERGKIEEKREKRKGIF